MPYERSDLSRSFKDMTASEMMAKQEYLRYQEDYIRFEGRRQLPLVREFEWLGWRGDPVELERAGWEIAQSISQPPTVPGVRASYTMRHRGIAEGFGTMHLSDQDWRELDEYLHVPRGYSPIQLRIGMKMAGFLSIVSSANVLSWERIDPRATIESAMYHYNLDQIPVFQTLNQRPSLILDRLSLDEVLEFAIEKQRPLQDRLRQQRVQQSKLVSELRLAL
jgi:hypothetical protein